METLKYRYDAALQSLETLKEALEIIQNPTYQEIYKTLRDSVIQRFEYSIDTLWKLLKLYLEEKQGVTFEKITPRAVLIAVADAQLINEKEYKILFECVTDRNLTSHTYRAALAEELAERIPLYYDTMNAILHRIKIGQ